MGGKKVLGCKNTKGGRTSIVPFTCHYRTKRGRKKNRGLGANRRERDKGG